MSHIVTIETQIRDPVALESACRRLGLSAPVERSVRLFSGEVTGLAVELPGWRYPVVCDLAQGSLQFDNFKGRWGEQCQLDRLQQAYAAEKCLLNKSSAGA